MATEEKQRQFKEWMRRMDAALNAECGFESRDLPDWGYWDAFAEGLEPEECVEEVLDWAKSF